MTPPKETATSSKKSSKQRKEPAATVPTAPDATIAKSSSKPDSAKDEDCKKEVQDVMVAKKKSREKKIQTKTKESVSKEEVKEKVQDEEVYENGKDLVEPNVVDNEKHRMIKRKERRHSKKKRGTRRTSDDDDDIQVSNVPAQQPTSRTGTKSGNSFGMDADDYSEDERPGAHAIEGVGAIVSNEDTVTTTNDDNRMEIGINESTVASRSDYMVEATLVVVDEEKGEGKNDDDTKNIVQAEAASLTDFLGTTKVKRFLIGLVGCIVLVVVIVVVSIVVVVENRIIDDNTGAPTDSPTFSPTEVPRDCHVIYMNGTLSYEYGADDYGTELSSDAMADHTQAIVQEVRGWFQDRFNEHETNAVGFWSWWGTTFDITSYTDETISTYCDWCVFRDYQSVYTMNFVGTIKIPIAKETEDWNDGNSPRCGSDDITELESTILKTYDYDHLLSWTNAAIWNNGGFDIPVEVEETAEEPPVDEATPNPSSTGNGDVSPLSTSTPTSVPVSPPATENGRETLIDNLKRRNLQFFELLDPFDTVTYEIVSLDYAKMEIGPVTTGEAEDLSTDSMVDLFDLPDYTLQTLVEDDPTSPQSKAFDWVITNYNRAYLESTPVWRRQQLFGLATFFYSMEGENWHGNDRQRWLDPTISECDWTPDTLELHIDERQLQCSNSSSPSGIGQVTSLELFRMAHAEYFGRTFQGRIPPEIGLFSSLQRLEINLSGLSGNLEEVIPNQLGQLKDSIQSLSITSNKDLTGTIPITIGYLTKLTWLGLHSNSLSGTIPVELGALTNLRILRLQRNDFDGTVPESICQLQIEQLIVDNCPVSCDCY